MTLFAAASGIGPFLLVQRRWGASELLMVPLTTSALLWAILGMTLGRPPLRAFALYEAPEEGGAGRRGRV